MTGFNMEGLKKVAFQVADIKSVRGAENYVIRFRPDIAVFKDLITPYFRPLTLVPNCPILNLRLDDSPFGVVLLGIKTDVWNSVLSRFVYEALCGRVTQ